MTTAVRDRLSHLTQRYVLRCTPELFGAYDLTLEHAASPSEWRSEDDSLVGVVGFVGDLCGTTLIRIDANMAAASHPLRARAEATVRMRLDWVGELANQLMGRLKVQLAAHGINFRVGAPISISADRLRCLGATGETYRGRFVSDSSQLEVWVDAEVRPSVLYSEAFFQDHEQQSAVEGTVMFL